MEIEFYYRDSEPGDLIFNQLRDELNCEDMDEEEEDELIDKKITELTKCYGNAASGDEDLVILIDTDKKGVIKVNGSKYKLIEVGDEHL